MDSSKIRIATINARGLNNRRKKKKKKKSINKNTD